MLREKSFSMEMSAKETCTPRRYAHSPLRLKPDSDNLFSKWWEEGLPETQERKELMPTVGAGPFVERRGHLDASKR